MSGRMEDVSRSEEALPGDGAARLVALSHDLMGALAPGGRLVWTNAAWEHALGWTAGDLADVPYATLLHPDDRTFAQEAEAALTAGTAHWPGIELRVRTRDGAYRQVLFSLVVSPEERLVYVSGKDVTDRAAAQDEHALSYARYRALIANLPDTVVTLYDTDLRILVTEGGQLARRGLHPAAFEGRRFEEVLPAAHYERLEPVYRAALQGEAQAIDVATPDGEVVYRTQAVPIYDEDGRLVGGLSVSRDVTERVRAQRTLEERAEELERSNAELAQFAYVASHDLSEPLRMVSSYLQLLRRRYRGQIDADADAFIDYAVDGAARMRTLIEDLLAYSRAGRHERPLEPVDTARIVSEVAETLRAQHGGPLPPRIEWDELPVVAGEPAQLSQLFQNLIGNGVKFVAPDTRARVRVSAEREDGGWRFAVRDNGIGIDARHLDRVFGMFQRLHTRDEFPGTGIGLAIAKKVVERHGGRIWAGAGEGGGTRFEFTLPEPGE